MDSDTERGGQGGRGWRRGGGVQGCLEGGSLNTYFPTARNFSAKSSLQ